MMASPTPSLPQCSDAAAKDKNKNEEKSGGSLSTCSGSSGVQPPDMFLCPISREVMRDPVVLVETGQMYDRLSIKEWFKMGHNTCPLTGGVAEQGMSSSFNRCTVLNVALTVGASDGIHACGLHYGQCKWE